MVRFPFRADINICTYFFSGQGIRLAIMPQIACKTVPVVNYRQLLLEIFTCGRISTNPQRRSEVDLASTFILFGEKIFAQQRDAWDI